MLPDAVDADADSPEASPPRSLFAFFLVVPGAGPAAPTVVDGLGRSTTRRTDVQVGAPLMATVVHRMTMNSDLRALVLVHGAGNTSLIWR